MCISLYFGNKLQYSTAASGFRALTKFLLVYSELDLLLRAFAAEEYPSERWSRVGVNLDRTSDLKDATPQEKKVNNSTN